MKKLDTKKVLIVMIGLPILLAIVIGGGAAILKGLATIAKAIFPNFWVVIAYIYVAGIAFFVGYKKSEKNAETPEP